MPIAGCRKKRLWRPEDKLSAANIVVIRQGARRNLQSGDDPCTGFAEPLFKTRSHGLRVALMG